ncbi:hypothetical protein [Amycolatopsis cihanbeyliensis]|uniref:ABC-type transport system involved in multi-copper enzyme maturation permease subunit n=1 Tax=Amycolatopsis cihanbeyliensis TaxID=1128664 RepID=A0A542DLK6_AMYCI|nr:hypothetical protein [Amycolatopsis cihanbeyliensis]TQJ03982.1 hypothetical protein FB471_3759 [Amycolatopsis cihanbeyliensis]
MTSRLRRFFWPLPPWVLIIPASAILGIVLASTWDMLSWRYQEWVQTSAQFHQQTAWAAPTAAMVAAFVAGRLTPPHRIYALPTSGRTGSPVILLHLRKLVGTLLAGYLLGLAPLVIVSAIDAQFGGPHILTMISGLLGMTAAIATGYLIGVIARTALVAPAAFLLIFGTTVLGYSGDSYAPVIPVLYVEPSLGQVENLPMVLFRCIFFLAVAAVAIIVSSLILANRRERTKASALSMWGAAAVPVVLAVGGLVTTPALFVTPSDPPRQCAMRADVEFCVHAGHRTELGPIMETLGPVIEAYGENQRKIVRIYDRALVLDETRVASNTHVVYLAPLTTPRPDDPEDSAKYHLAGALTGQAACREQHPAEIGGAAGSASGPITIQSDLETWLARAGELESIPNAFQDFSPEEMSKWIAENNDAIESCSTRKDDIRRQ